MDQRSEEPSSELLAIDIPAEKSWAIAKSAATGAIVLRFVGPTRTEEIAQFFAALSEMMPEKDAQILFDLRELHGHNPEIKLPATRWLLDHKSRIGQITVVLRRAAALHKLVVAVLSVATGVKMKVRDDLGGESFAPTPP
ncbi:MAG TPA: hypothetical protein VFS67_31780 [Polyangiaceae bacterium]|jgi:hypothetical protein|nr:hypothetical protein [Polyangiaceae bacterium]